VFGAYLSAVGISLVFLTLLIVAGICIVVRRLFQEEPKAPLKQDLRKVAAIAAVYCYIDDVTRSGPRPIRSGTSSRWSVVARSEATQRRIGEQ